MTLEIHADPNPLRVDDAGAVRVGHSRVLLDLVVYAYREGMTPEETVDQLPTLLLPDVYAAIGYYLRHQEEVDAFILKRERSAEQKRLEHERRFPSTGFREELVRRLAAKSVNR